MKRLLIANRGEIAVRIMRSARALGIEVVAVYADVDVDAPHVRGADAAYRIAAETPVAAYLDGAAIVAAAALAGADAIHPGYGFLAERPDFAQRCATAGITFVGPSAAAMEALGNKAAAKRRLAEAGVPFLPGYHGADQDDAVLERAAHELGMPVMIKAAAGGGGRGMRLVLEATGFADALRAARSEALAAFGDADVLLERALIAPRHVEVQIFADAFGNVVHLGERDCSVQRRHQKLIEEAPSPAVDAALRERLGAAAIAVARAADYAGAGTVEFLLDASGAFYFIEMNARLQVEHPVTEAITGFDLVAWQLRIARGERLPVTQAEIVFRGHAIEARLCAEDAARGFLPQAGRLVAWEPPPALRVEHALENGAEISPYFDSMMAKIIAYGDTRDEARVRLASGLRACVALGLPTNAAALAAILDDPVFAAGAATTRFIEDRAAALVTGQPSRVTAALAAALIVAQAAERSAFGAWTAWRPTPLPPSVVRFASDDGIHDARVDALGAAEFTVEIAGIANRIALDAGTSEGRHARRVRIDDGPWTHVAYAAAGSLLYLSLAGEVATLQNVTDTPAASAAALAGDGFLRAPMSGRVAAIATAGDSATAGATLVVLEAMKMEHVLTLPVDVRVQRVSVAVGAQVSATNVLLEYEPLAL